MTKRYRAVSRTIDGEHVADMVETSMDGYVTSADYDALAARLARVEHERNALRGAAQEMIDCYHESGGMPNWKYFIRLFQPLMAADSASVGEAPK